MDANELVRIKSVGKAANSLPQQVTATAGVHLNVIPRCFHPRNFVGVDEHYAPRSFDHQSLSFRFATGLGQQVKNAMGQLTIVYLQKLSSRSFDSRMKPILVDRLQKKVESARFERSHRVLMVDAG